MVINETLTTHSGVRFKILIMSGSSQYIAKNIFFYFISMKCYLALAKNIDIY
ncbi:hypothetical protein Aazo_0237 ['Nostoc azollae' 0708]|uniref:Uncharacterized protein n=1 Tax=Nostoc azollae (strain 0708) TaxID=551115 RepID=D7DYM8_NOSA0|nr:hypothetical protein Aazo_0237 ['Nostoc azollae' 0708]